MKSLADALAPLVATDAELDARLAEAQRRRRERTEARNAAVLDYWTRFRRGEGVSLMPAEPMDELGPCDTCRGARWVKVPKPGGQPWEHDVIRCPRCPAAVKLARADADAERQGLDVVQRSRRFATFAAVPGTEAARAAAEGWARDPRGWLVLTGVPGSGKTHLSLAVANHLLDVGAAVRWWYAADLAAAFKDAIGTNETRGLLARWAEFPLLVLDDLGAARTSDFVVRECFEPLFNLRERHRLPTLVTCISAEGIKELMSQSVGRRMEDPSLSRIVPITAGQYGLEP
jgi:chromosomal replication initiation ATPase DnaA